MNLLIDIGNTNLRWAVHADGQLGDTQCARHSGGVPLDVLADWERLPRPDQVVIANVAGAAVFDAVARVVRAYWGRTAEAVSTRDECLGVRVAYGDPARFGVDRWLGLLAVHGQCAGPSLIVDAGTAVTYDGLLADGRHLGGLILPGLGMMRDALLSGTRILPGGVDAPVGPWATDTAAAVANGGIMALVALTERLLNDLTEQVREGAAIHDQTLTRPTLWLTGGDAEPIAALLKRPHRLVPDLVLRGLARLIEDGGL